MTTAPPPVREPAWSLSRSAISLWVTEGVIASLFLGIGAVAFALFVPDDLGGPFPVLRWLIPVAAVVMWTRDRRLVCVTFGSSTIVGVRFRCSIAGFGIVSTPGVVVDGKVVHAGGLPRSEDVAKWLAA